MEDFALAPITYIYNNINHILESSRHFIDAMLAALSPLSQKACALLIIYTGLRLVLGYGDVRESLSTLFKVSFIMTILYAANVGFQQFIIPGIYGLRDFISNAVGNKSGDNIYSQLDMLVSLGITISQSAFDSSDLFDPTTYPYFFYGALIIIVTVILTGIMLFIMLGAEIVLIFLVTFGPLAIILFLFSSTRGFFFQWVNTVFANVLLFIIGVFFISLSNSAIQEIIKNNHIIERTQAVRLTENGSAIYSQNDPEMRKALEDYRTRKENIENRRINELLQNGCSTSYGHLTQKCSKIEDKYISERKKLEQENKDRQRKIFERTDKEFNEIKKIADQEPANHIIYISLLIIFGILIKLTFEIPSIAQSLSGGTAAGASAAALATQGLRMMGQAVSDATKGGYRMAKRAFGPPPPMQQMLNKMDAIYANSEKQTALLERFDPRPAQPHPEPTPAPRRDGDPSPKPNPAEETKPGKIKDETHIAAPQNPQNAPEPAATPPQPAKPAEEGKGQETTGAETGKTVGNDSNKIDSPEKADVNVNTHVDADVIAKGGRNSGGDGGSPNNGLPSNAAHGASGIGGAIDSAQRESAQQQSQTGSNTQPSTPATSGGSGSKGTPSASNSTTPPAPQNEKKPSITDPKGNKPPKEPPIKKL